MKGKCIFIITILLASFSANTSFTNSFSELGETQISFVQEGSPLDNTSNLVWGDVTVSEASDTSLSVDGYGTTFDSDGNYYVVGQHYTSFRVDDQWINKTTPGTNAFLLKFFSNGTLDWGITGVSAANSYASGVAIGPNGSIYITGTVDGSVSFGGISTSNPDGLFVAKFSSSGQPLWAKTSGSGQSFLGGLDIVVDQNGYAYVSGMNYLGGNYDAFVAKIDSDGNWAGYEASNDFGGDALDSATGITMDEQGFIYVSMTNFSSSPAAKSVVTVMKFNKSNLLNPIWSKNLASGDYTVATVCGGSLTGCKYGGGIEIDSGGDIVLIGTSRTSNSGSRYTAFAAKMDSNGSTLWSSKLPIQETAETNSYPTGLIIDKFGNLLISGHINNGNMLGSSAGGGYDLFLAKIDPDGVFVDGFSYGTDKGELLYDSAMDSDGRIIVVGKVQQGQFGDNTVTYQGNADMLFIADFGKDYDQDGIVNSVDSDVDGDGVGNTNDECEYSPIYFISSGGTDHDSDGCKDDTEDSDDDNDGITDSNDSCPSGTIAWVPTNFTDQDNDGCQDSSEDLDDDADGYLDQQDRCPKTFGNSSVSGDLGCVDSDGDGRSDFNDQFPDDASEWQDSDMDLVGDNSDPFEFDATQWEDADGDGHGDNPYGTLGDKFPLDTSRWQDSDDDGYADEDDLFPNEKSQWTDQDGDGYGDNALGDRGDAFPEDSTEWLDSDFDGLGDNTDEFPYDVSQQSDSDGDGYGDADDGNRADRFPDDPTQWSDIDYDGYGDNPNGTSPDAFPTDATQWLDSDGDGYGDNPAGRQYDVFPNNPTQWEDYDGDGLGDNQNGTDADPYLNDLDNDGFNDTVDLLPRFASPGDMDADGCLDEADLFPQDSRECFDFDGDGEGDNLDPDDDNDGWADTDEVRQGTDPFDSSSKPIDGFEVIIPGTEISLGAWDLIGIFGGFPLFIWIAFGFVTRNTRCAKYEAMLREANTRDELESVAYKWEYSLMLRMLGPHQGIRLERLRAELDDKFEAMDQPLSSIENHEFDQTQMVVEEMNDTEKQVPELVTQSDYPSIEDTAQKTDENGYEWFTAQDGTNFYRTIGSQADWTRLEN
jgi:hypothetical protein